MVAGLLGWWWGRSGCGTSGCRRGWLSVRRSGSWLRFSGEPKSVETTRSELGSDSRCPEYCTTGGDPTASTLFSRIPPPR